MAEDEFDAMEASLRRRQAIVRIVYAAIAVSPLVVIGYCVKQMVHHERPHEVKLSADELRAVREVARASDRAVGGRVAFAAPAAILEQLRSTRPSAAPCPHPLRARQPDVTSYEPPAFQLTQLTEQELSAAKADERAAPVGDDLEVIFLVDHRREGVSSGVAFTPGRVTGRAYLWSHSAGQIVCAGDVTASSSPSVKVQRTTINGTETTSFGTEDHGILSADLDRQLERAIAVGLRVVASAR